MVDTAKGGRACGLLRRQHGVHVPSGLGSASTIALQAAGATGTVCSISQISSQLAPKFSLAGIIVACQSSGLRVSRSRLCVSLSLGNNSLLGEQPLQCHTMEVCRSMPSAHAVLAAHTLTLASPTIPEPSCYFQKKSSTCLSARTHGLGRRKQRALWHCICTGSEGGVGMGDDSNECGAFQRSQ